MPRSTNFPQAIETRYANCRFRSRTEARWAVAFDALGEPWQYELNGYYIRDPSPLVPPVRYLPDFWLPDRRLWVEVKGAEAALAKEWPLLSAAVHPRYGLPLDPSDGLQEFPDLGEVPRLLVLGSIPRSQNATTVRAGFLLFELLDGCGVVRRCDLLGHKTAVLLDFEWTHSICLPARCLDLEGCDVEVIRTDEELLKEEARRINYALSCARSARFEHGEQPVVKPWRAGESQPW